MRSTTSFATESRGVPAGTSNILPHCAPAGRTEPARQRPTVNAIDDLRTLPPRKKTVVGGLGRPGADGKYESGESAAAGGPLHLFETGVELRLVRIGADELQQLSVAFVVDGGELLCVVRRLGVELARFL